MHKENIQLNEPDNTLPIDKIIIRKAESQDAKTLETIATETEETNFKDGTVHRSEYFNVAIKYGVVFVAEIENQIVGFILGDAFETTLLSELTYFVVRDESRNKGIGKKLMDAYLQECRNRNIKRISLFAPTYNKRTHKFYENSGFDREKEYVLFSKKL